MTTSQVKIIFPAILGANQFDTQLVKLGGVHPDIEITLVEKKNGLHEFGIIKFIPNTHPSMLTPVIAEAEDQINLFWNILSFVRDTTIKATGEILYEFQGLRHIITPSSSIQIRATLNGVAKSGWFDVNLSAFHKKYDLDLLKRYNFSRSIEEPIGKFISLYSLLSSLAEDKQEKIDALIENVDPSVAKYLPKERRMETIYTRLRNELAHNRKGSSISETHSEVTLHLPKFEWIIKEVLSKYIVIN
jgi:hypothetical protein